MDPLTSFATDHYRRHNSRRLEHLATLGLDLSDRRVLELGAGIGDHTSFFLDRGCRVTALEGRPENVEILKVRFPSAETLWLDLDDDETSDLGRFEIVYAYGVLYHLAEPRRAIARMSAWCSDLLLLETCVSFGVEAAVNPVAEDANDPSQSVRGLGCRPTRRWVIEVLRSQFAHVYVPMTQPWHEEFPVDWSQPALSGGLTRAIFIASRRLIENPLLVKELPDRQTRAG
jgi:Methyltransferase domain